MSDFLPRPLLHALSLNMDSFMGKDDLWYLHVEQSVKRIQRKAKTQVLAFANNGKGKYLFLKKRSSGNGYDEKVFLFKGRWSPIEDHIEDIATTLGFSKRPPSNDDFPRAIYKNGQPIIVGDSVKFLLWTKIWKGRQKAEVTYVPGQSSLDYNFEYKGKKRIRVSNNEIDLQLPINSNTGMVGKISLNERRTK